MSHSLNELRALTTRAARGAGFDWGMADESGHAVCWLASFGLPGPALFARRLLAEDGTPAHELMPAETPAGSTVAWFGGGGRLCPLLAGAALSDHAYTMSSGTPHRLEGVICPLLLLPFAARVAHQLGRNVAVEWSGIHVVTDGLGLFIEGDRGRLGVTSPTIVTCTPRDIGQQGSHEPIQRATHTRVTLAPERVETLTGFAQRTYAPAT